MQRTSHMTGMAFLVQRARLVLGIGIERDHAVQHGIELGDARFVSLHQIQRRDPAGGHVGLKGGDVFFRHIIGRG